VETTARARVGAALVTATPREAVLDISSARERPLVVAQPVPLTDKGRWLKLECLIGTQDGRRFGIDIG